MAEINLLPISSQIKGSTAKLARSLKIVGLAGTLIFFLLGLGMLALFFFNSEELKASSVRQGELKASIEILKTTEQQHVLIKNRAGNISEIWRKNDVLVSLESLEEMLSRLPSGAKFSSIEISPKRFTVTLQAENSSDLTQALAIIVAQDSFEDIILTSFALKPASGYSLTFEMKGRK